MDKKKAVKIKATVKQSAEKITSSESVNKAKATIVDTTEKIKNGETYDKAKSTVNDVADKVANAEIGEKAKELIDSAKAKNIKANKIIKIGAIALIVVVLFSLFSNVFSEERKVEKIYKDNVLSSDYYFSNQKTTRNYKVIVKCVAKEKTKDANYYALRSETYWEEPVYFDDENGNEKMKWEEKTAFDLVIIKYKNGSWEDTDHNTYYKHNDGYYKQALHNAKEHFKQYKKNHK